MRYYLLTNALLLLNNCAIINKQLRFYLLTNAHLWSNKSAFIKTTKGYVQDTEDQD